VLAGLCSLSAALSDVLELGFFVLTVASFVLVAFLEEGFVTVLDNDTRAAASWL